MPGGSEFRLHQGFGLRPKHLHGAKAPRARRPLQRNAVSFSYAYAKKQALRCRGKPAFCIDWVPHTANRASCECSPSREGTPCSDFGRTHLNAPTRSEEPEHFRPQFLLVSPLPAGMGWHPAVHCYRTRTIFFAIPGNFFPCTRSLNSMADTIEDVIPHLLNPVATYKFDVEEE